MTRSKRIAEQLGMSHGAAANRLRKQLLYKYVKLAGDHFCYKCGSEIESVKELSIEHKEPWENRDAELFWNMDNLAFSHMRCNKQHNTAKTSLRREHPEGMSWCVKCKEYLPVDSFWVDRSQWTGRDKLCKQHRVEQRDKSRQSRKERGLKVN